MHMSFLRPLYTRTGPFGSVYLDSSRDTEDAAHALKLRWKAARKQLEDAGAGPKTIEVLENEAQINHGGRGLAMFAAEGDLVLVEALPTPPRREIAAYGPLPHTMPLAVLRGERVPWARVVVNHIGADILGITEGGVPRAGHVEGHENYPIRKVKAGGWSMPRYQRAAEVTWERNATEVAAMIAEVAESTGAEVLILAGDPRSRPLLIEHLPTRWRSRVVEVDAAGADSEVLDDATARAVAARAAEITAAAIDRFNMEWGRGGAAANGLPAVVSALQRGQVDTLLLVDDQSSTAEVWIGPDPLELSFDPEELRAMGVDEPVRQRADAAIVRALVATEADLVLVRPGEVPLTDGIAAVLRYVDPVTRHR